MHLISVFGRSSSGDPARSKSLRIFGLMKRLRHIGLTTSHPVLAVNDRDGDRSDQTNTRSTSDRIGVHVYPDRIDVAPHGACRIGWPGADRVSTIRDREVLLTSRSALPASGFGLPRNRAGVQVGAVTDLAALERTREGPGGNLHEYSQFHAAGNRLFSCVGGMRFWLEQCK